MGARDSQRQRLYNAERAFWNSEGGVRGRERLESVGEMQKWVDKIVGSAWWRKRSAQWSVGVEPGYGARRAFSRGGSIVIPKWGRSRWVILHELAHEARGSAGWLADHGPEFARRYVELVRRWIGEEESRGLEAVLKAGRVRVGPRTTCWTPQEWVARRVVAARQQP